MSLTDYLTLALCTWRLSHLVAREEGPFEVLSHWRRLWGAIKPMNGEWDAPHWYGRLWLCPLCLSIWIAPALLYLYVRYDVFTWVALAVAISGASSWLELISRRSR